MYMSGTNVQEISAVRLTADDCPMIDCRSVSMIMQNITECVRAFVMFPETYV